MNHEALMRTQECDAVDRTISMLSPAEMAQIESDPTLNVDSLDIATGEKLRRGLVLWRAESECDLVAMPLFDPSGCGVNAWGDALHECERSRSTANAMLKAIRKRLQRRHVLEPH